MKKTILIILCALLLSVTAGCTVDSRKTSQSSESQAQLTGSLEDLIAELYETAVLSPSFREFVSEGMQTVAISPEQSEFYFGTEIEFAEAAASEPLISRSAYLLALLRVKDDQDIDATVQAMKEHADPMRWICVGVDPANVVVDHVGDVIILIMSDQEKEPLHDAFLALGQ